MKYSTEDQQFGSIAVSQLAGPIDTLFDLEAGTVADGAKTLGYTLLTGLGIYAAIKALPLLNEVRTSFTRSKKAKFDLLESEARAAEAVKRASRG